MPSNFCIQLKIPQSEASVWPCGSAAGYCSPLSHLHVLSAGFIPIPVPQFPYFGLLGMTAKPTHQGAAALSEPWGEQGTLWCELTPFLWSPRPCGASQVTLMESTSLRAGAIPVPSSWEGFKHCAVEQNKMMPTSGMGQGSWRLRTLQAFSFTASQWQPCWPIILSSWIPIILLNSDTILQPKAKEEIP